MCYLVLEAMLSCFLSCVVGVGLSQWCHRPDQVAWIMLRNAEKNYNKALEWTFSCSPNGANSSRTRNTHKSYCAHRLVCSNPHYLFVTYFPFHFPPNKDFKLSRKTQSPSAMTSRQENTEQVKHKIINKASQLYKHTWIGFADYQFDYKSCLLKVTRCTIYQKYYLPSRLKKKKITRCET